MTATSTSTSTRGTFVTVPGDRHSEVARTLAEPVPQALSLVDQLGLWGNLGVSLLGFTGAWAAGFVTYQLINPGYVSWWASAWTSFASAIGFTPASWMSASICSFVVAALVTLLVSGLTSLTRARRRPAPAGEQRATTA